MSHYPHEISSKINKSILSILKSYTTNADIHNKNRSNSTDENNDKNPKKNNSPKKSNDTINDNDMSSNFNPIDILRIIKNESILLYEKQTILDNFDLDPHGIGWNIIDNDNDNEDPLNINNNILHDKIQNILNDLIVKSCRRTDNDNDNTSTIEAIIEIKKQDWMNVNDNNDDDDDNCNVVHDNIKLKFLYQRFNNDNFDSSNNDGNDSNSNASRSSSEADNNDDENNKNKKRKFSNANNAQTEACDDSNSNNPSNNEDNDGTIIRYNIDISKDNQELYNIITLQISSKYPYPYLHTDDGEEDDYGCNVNEENILNAMSWLNVDDDNEEENDGSSNIHMYTFILILMTFPFYEYEWNLMDCLLDDDSDCEMIHMSDASFSSSNESE